MISLTPCQTDADAPTTKRPTAASSAHTYASRPCPSGWRVSAGRLLLRSAISKNTPLPVSAHEWRASATIEADPESAPATDLAAAIAAFVLSAISTVRVLCERSSVPVIDPPNDPRFNQLRLTGRAPEHLAAVQNSGQHRGTA